MRKFVMTFCLLLTFCIAGQAFGQTTSTKDRLVARPATVKVPIARKLQLPIQNIRLENVPVKQAFEWWSGVTNIPLVVHWSQMEQYGLERDTPVSLKLKAAPAGVTLKLIMDMFSQEEPLVVEVTDWFVQVMTRDRANRKTIRKIYNVGDLIMSIPNFDSAPNLDLTAALSNSSSSGGGANASSSSSTIFASNDKDESDSLTRDERGENIADIIRETIEPDIWIANGGSHSSVKYLNGMLIVNAPYYVHQQIGPTYDRSVDSATRKKTNSFKSNVGGPIDGFQPIGRYRSNGVSGINPSHGKVSGKSGKD